MAETPTAPVESGTDALVSLGLIDLSSIDRWDRNEDEAPAAPAAAPAQEAPAKPAAPEAKAVDWESADNPYKQRVAAQNEPNVQVQLAELRAAIPEAVEQVTEIYAAQGMEVKAARDAARNFVQAQANAFATKLQSDDDRRQIFKTGAVQQAAALKLAKAHSTDGVKITAEELADAPTIDAMTERAKTLQSTRRDAAFKARAAAGKDSVEGGAGTGGINRAVLDKLSPEQMIAYGLKHHKY